MDELDYISSCFDLLNKPVPGQEHSEELQDGSIGDDRLRSLVESLRCSRAALHEAEDRLFLALTRRLYRGD